MVKGIYNFWRIQGNIDRLNDSCKKIFSGVVKIANDSMSEIFFSTTPKGNLPHYYYIFRKLDPLGMAINNGACFMLGNMLHLDIQKGKETMNTSKFQ